VVELSSDICLNKLLDFRQVKKPGLEMATEQSELDLSYGQRYQDTTIPEAYERLILDTYVLVHPSSPANFQTSLHVSRLLPINS
jgi:glucose-6-phosphate 1-dehydrogenase